MDVWPGLDALGSKGLMNVAAIVTIMGVSMMFNIFIMVFYQGFLSL